MWIYAAAKNNEALCTTMMYSWKCTQNGPLSQRVWGNGCKWQKSKLVSQKGSVGKDACFIKAFVCKD